MLGGNGDRLAKAQSESLVEPLGARLSLALVGNRNGRHAGGQHTPGKHGIGRDHAFPRIEHKQHQVGVRQGQFALAAHAPGDRLGGRVLQACGIDHGHRVAGDHRLAVPAIARQPRHVGDQGSAPTGQAVEEGRLANIGPADDGNGWGHACFARGRRWYCSIASANSGALQLNATSRALSVSTYMRLPATTGPTKTGWPRSCVPSTLPVWASTLTSWPLLEASQRRLPANTGPDQVEAPGSLAVHWILPSRRVIAISWPPVSTTNTESPAT